MTKQIMKRGFTLIELLVVIAIIGILAAVVLASLNNARDKGEDAAIRQNLTNARAQAELYYDDANRSYEGVCAATSDNNGVADLISGANSAGGGTDAECADNDEAWAVEKQLNDGDYYCVDYSGEATTTAGSSGLSDDDTATNPAILCDGADGGDDN